MRRVALIILDGWGMSPRRDYNAIELGKTLAWHELMRKYPLTLLSASGESVGLRAGLMGNSEVGHLNIGAGRVVWQEITLIDRAIDEGTFAKKPAFQLPAKGTVHLMGLVSDGGVHSAEKHYFELLKMFPDRHRFHVFLDGRDTPSNAGLGYVRRLVERGAKIGSIMGRYWAMDRDKRWDRVEKAYNAVVCGEAEFRAADPVRAVEEAYALGETDEFLKPRVLGPGIADGDSVIFFNFRADRARELTRALTERDFKEFPRKAWPRVTYASMTRYHEDWTHLPCGFEPQPLRRIFGQVLADHKLGQLRIAETEKYAHVTFFFNGGSDTPFPGEERILVPSPKVATYDLKPEMSAFEVTEKAVAAIESDRFHAMVLNFANPDMVGHTGILEAAIKAVEVVDRCLQRLIVAARRKGWTLLVTADHGNCEQMIDFETGQSHTYHTTNPVPFVVVGDEFIGSRLREGETFKSISPTMLHLLGLEKPPEMEGSSLLIG